MNNLALNFTNDRLDNIWQGELSASQVRADWQRIVQDFLQSATGQSLQEFLLKRKSEGAVIYPPKPFKALSLTSLADVKVVILGQDPYHGAGQAEGLAFSVAKGMKIPRSLSNIFKERHRDLGIPPAPHGSLRAWAEQGVLLLNTSLTVESGKAASHSKKGWESLTDQLIEACAKKESPVVFLLWGRHALAKQELIAKHNSNRRHDVLTCSHPSPLSASKTSEPFIGCGHFGRVRRFFAKQSANKELLFS